MDKPPVEIVAPTSRAWHRMVSILFRPFDLAKWCVLGFTAWLATLMENSGSSFNGPSGDPNSQDIDEFFSEAGEFISSNLEWIIPLAVLIALVFIALFVVLTWVSSRGKFMFLDNVVHNRALVGFPWKLFRQQGNSLFRWRVWFAVISIPLVILIMAPSGWSIYQLSQSKGDASTWITILIVCSLLFMAVILILVVIGLFLEDFVVPLMYRHSLSTNEAWRMFLPVFKSRIGTFVLFILWRILLGMGGAIVILTVSFATCCIGLILIAIPYVGTVILLPMSVFFRSISLEFLRQFGPDYDPLTTEEFPVQTSV